MTPTTDQASPAGDTTTGGTGFWLYGVIADRTAAALTGLAGLGGRRPRTIAAAGLAAVVGAVPLAEYGQGALRRNFEDLAWLERTARAHHAVLDMLHRAGPVLPAALATLYRDAAGIVELLTEQHADLTVALDRVTGHAEWGVKGYAETRSAPEPGTGPPATGPGAAYLARRRADLTARADARHAREQDAAAIHAALTSLSAGARRHPAQDRRLTGVPADMVLNGAYLVPAGRQEEFGRLVATLRLRHPAVRLERTGPWPPYSFVGDTPSSPESLP
jgi:hypothetical protein